MNRFHHRLRPRAQQAARIAFASLLAVILAAAVTPPGSGGQQKTKPVAAAASNCCLFFTVGGRGNSKATPALPARAASRSLSAAASELPVYTIGPNDVLTISVWHEKDLSATLPVRPDGKISLPLIGQVQAAGYTPLQFQQVLTEKLKAYIDQPRVTVVVNKVLSRTYNVLGKVTKPGSYPLDRPMTVLDALAAAGGPAEFANTKKMYVLRSQKDGTHKIYPFNYNQVIKGRLPWENIELQPGDTVVVP
ncbi:MAG: polysaccharide biosynthesis/export family protein [Terriglobales bacterium]